MKRCCVYMLALAASFAGCDREDATRAVERERARVEQEAVARAQAKVAAMKEEVERLAKMRQGLSARIDELQQAVSTDPARAAGALQAALAEHFSQSPDIETLFGPDLAKIGDDGIRRTFQLFKEATALRVDLGYLTGFLQANAAVLTGEGAPRRFAVQAAGEHVVLVERGDPLCGDEPCRGDNDRPTGWRIRSNPREPFKSAKIGAKEGEVRALAPEGEVYVLAIGQSPENNARNTAAMLFARVKEDLEEMSKSERRALKALERYTADPTKTPADEPDVE